MAMHGNLHSRLVAWMKIILPLAALGMLSTLFLISETFDPSEPLPVVGIDLQQRAQDEGATNATFAGVTRSGHEIVVQTRKSQPSQTDPRIFFAEDVSARFNLSSGTDIDIASDGAEVNQRLNTATLSGRVKLVTTTGYTLETEELTTQFDTLYAETPGEVTGTAPAGDLVAGRMVLYVTEDSGKAHLLFTDGVKLVYEPQDPEE